MKISELQALMESGQFHHATYRCIGSLWEGLWIYKRSTGARGFDAAGSFLKDDANLESAHAMVRKACVSVGAFGQG